MQWEALTAPDFEKAVRETGVCILPLGVLERHSDHLPLGTDFLVVHKVACLAAEIEPAVVFPPFYFGQIYEARCFPGALTIKPTLLIELLQSVMDEIGRNGFKKIILLNGHGGNSALLPFLAQCALWEQKPYTIYLVREWFSDEQEREWEAMRDTTYGGHACEHETSMLLGIYPEYARMDQVPEKPGQPLERLKDLTGAYTGIWWYADYPNHYAGDARTASKEKGDKLVRMAAQTIAKHIAKVKADEVAPALEEEFFKRAKGL
jgi:creatinine amidohydrolase